jgi:hypothetical protein
MAKLDEIRRVWAPIIPFRDLHSITVHIWCEAVRVVAGHDSWTFSGGIVLNAALVGSSANLIT